MRLLREPSRRKLRTTLTIVGITITDDAEVGASCDRIIRMRDGRGVADERVTGSSAAA